MATYRCLLCRPPMEKHVPDTGENGTAEHIRHYAQEHARPDQRAVSENNAGGPHS